MVLLNNSSVYEFPSNTVQDVRRYYDLDKPGIMDQVIDMLENWVQKQKHFVKKDFGREYLERCIITCKGSVERAKLHMDRFFTLRSTLPQAYWDIDAKVYQKIIDHAPSVSLPKFAPDYHRVFLTKCWLKQSDPAVLDAFYKYSVAFCDYMKSHDYSNGLIFVMDYRELSIKEFVSSINPIDLRFMVNLYIEGYSVRIKGIHVITPSKLVDVLVKLLKQVTSPKLRERFHVHQSIEELYQVVPKEILPVEYGGKEKSLKELQEDWCAVLNTEEHRIYMRELSQSVIVDSYRFKDNYKSDNLGTPGSFRTLAID